jgi:hypothetical protein
MTALTVILSVTVVAVPVIATTLVLAYHACVATTPAQPQANC